MKPSTRIRLQHEKTVQERRRLVLLRLQRKAIAKAKEKTGSDGKTAKVLAMSPQKLCDIKAGRRVMPAAAAARLANLLNLDSFTAMTQALAHNAKSKSSRLFWLEYGNDIWFLKHQRYAAWAANPKANKYPL